MSDLFRNPYHFVPLAAGQPPARVPTADIAAPWPGAGSASSHLTHDRYVPGTHSGRITCRATVETPLICGNRQEETKDWTKHIHPFEIIPGQPALPASSLRGMLSALAEAATHSALRVLKGDVLSYRRNMNDAYKLSALGQLVAGDKEGELRLLPLAVPTLELFGDKYKLYHEKENEKPVGDYRGIFPKPALKVYLGTNRYGSQAFRDSRGQTLQNATLREDGTVGPFYGMKLAPAPSTWSSQYSLPARQNWQRYPRGGADEHYLIGRQPQSPEVVPWEDGMESKGYTRGLFRGLGLWGQGRADDAPNTKKHELFIPFTKDMEQWPTLPVRAATIERFHQLADQRTDDEKKKTLPFEPLGTRKRKPGDSLRLKAGDIVYFRPEWEGGRPFVAEVCFSSIWRGRVQTKDGKGADTRAFFEALSSDLLPLHAGRSQLTLAEQLFGAVEVREKHQQDDAKEVSAFALASRLRVSHGHVTQTPEGSAYQGYEEWLPEKVIERLKATGKADLPLHNLASPKPPSPALYFTQKSGRDPVAVKKHELSPTLHEPHGRKFYLRRNPSKLRAQDIFLSPARLTETGIADQHQSVKKFVRSGTEFEFHLQFDNLSDLEIQLLLYLLRPTVDFRHQIGHGKPLGLGQMKLEITGLDLVNRMSRYATDDLTDVRSTSALEQVADHHEAFRAWAASKGLAEVIAAFELLGTPPDDNLPIHYPQAFETDPGRHNNQLIERGRPNFETENFRWFVQNEKLNPRHDLPQQYLESLIGQQHLPTLRREQGKEPKPRPMVERRARQQDQPAAAERTSTPPSAESWVGTIQPFKVTKLNENKLQFQIARTDLFTKGSVDQSIRLKMAPTLQLHQIISLRIDTYNPSGNTFLLSLPET